MLLPRLIILSLLLSQFVTFCAHTVLINDFFGIEMNPKDQSAFEIKKYSVKDGASYTSSPDMNPAVYCWAEIQGKTIQFKVVNRSDKPIRTSWISDRSYIILKNGEKYILENLNRDAYSETGTIKPGDTKNFVLKIPNKFWESFGLYRSSKKPVEDFWIGESQINIAKKDIDRIVFTLGGKTTLILKAVPKASK